jgi:HK97 family phage portal protein
MGLFDFWRGQQAKTITLDGIKFEICRSNNVDGDRVRVDLLSLPSVAGALDIKSNDVAQLPLYLFARTDAGRERLKTALDYQLSSQPNPYTNSFQFWKTAAVQAMVGECFITCRGGQMRILPFGYGVRYTTPAGEVRYARLATPDELIAARAKPGDKVIMEDFSYTECLHLFESANEDGNPVPLRVRFKAVLGLGSDITAFSVKLYSRGGLFAGYLQSDASVPDDQKKLLTDNFKAVFKSARATDRSDIKIALVDHGLKFNKLDLTPEEMRLAESKKDFKHDVAAMLHLPLWKVGIMDDYKYASAEQAQRDYLQQSLNPLLVQIEREVNTKLIAPFERDMVYAEFARDKAIAIDSKTMADIDDLACKSGGMSINEWRARRNLPAVAGGDFRPVPVNVTSAAFVEQAEALKLESLKLANALKAAELTDATAPTPEPPPTADGPDATALAALQSELADGMGDAITDPEMMASMVGKAMERVATMYKVDPVALSKFCDTYTESARSRAGATAVTAYECNRAINAASHEVIRFQHGASSTIRWVGGARDGQTRSINDSWEGKLRHPPLSAEEVNCFIVKHAA